MIRSFADKETERVHDGQHSRKLASDMQQTARRKLRALNRAKRLTDLAAARGNRLEQLKGDHKETYSLRINDQWRITFR
jgi:proteic killer suppression protein